jgi:pimeloyl-ACP methyl ester carboxylesterase
MPTPAPNGAPLTVVLVHGAFADSSSWNGVIERLLEVGVGVVDVPNPLRGLRDDADYVGSFLRQVPGPILLVGHSYGGAVITNAAYGADNVVGLVYVAAFCPERGERIADIRSNDSVLRSALKPMQYPAGDDNTTELEFVIEPSVFRSVFANDLPPSQAALLAVTQRPIAEQVLGETSGTPAWKTLPAWSVVPSHDRVVGTDAVRSMAERAGATIIEVRGSHVIMVSQPRAVTDVILRAAAAVVRGPAPTAGRRS